MTDFLRFLRMGIINVLGITVPGLLLLMFFTLGFVLPLFTGFVALCQRFLASDELVCPTNVAAIWVGNKTLIVTLALILAYIAGYIIRLSTPDDLDKTSARFVLKKMGEDAKNTGEEAARKDEWPFRAESGDKFPYYHFKEYLLARGLNELAELVKWGPPEQGDGSKRSKTHINAMKLDVLTQSPELSAVIESNEAHVRLMFGTWAAITTSRYLVAIGAVVSLGCMVTLAVIPRQSIPFVGFPFGTLFFLGVILLTTMRWARARIENLFHYQRVRELTHIVACAYYARGKEEGMARGSSVA